MTPVFLFILHLQLAYIGINITSHKFPSNDGVIKNPGVRGQNNTRFFL